MVASEKVAVSDTTQSPGNIESEWIEGLRLRHTGFVCAERISVSAIPSLAGRVLLNPPGSGRFLGFPTPGGTST